MFGLTVTDLIQQRYPHLRVGPAAVCRCTVIPLSLGLVSHGYDTGSEGLYKKKSYAGRDVKFPFLQYERI